MKLVREHINEKFTEESDPIHDMGIGGISVDFKQKKKELLLQGINKHDMGNWLAYLTTLNGKRITGIFKNKKITETFVIVTRQSWNYAKQLYFYDKDHRKYEIDYNKTYFIFIR